jgi:hypothetical protein
MHIHRLTSQNKFFLPAFSHLLSSAPLLFSCQMRHPQTLKSVQIPSATDSLFFLAPNISNHTPKGSKPKQWNLLLVAAPTQA